MASDVDYELVSPHKLNEGDVIEVQPDPTKPWDIEWAAITRIVKGRSAGLYYDVRVKGVDRTLRLRPHAQVRRYKVDEQAVGTVCPDAHEGPHQVLLNGTFANGPRIADVVRHALAHAVEDELQEGDMEAALAALTRADQQRDTGYYVEVDDAELASLERAMGSACNYMTANHYAERSDTKGGDSPEDTQAAQLLGDGGIAYACWTRSLVR